MFIFSLVCLIVTSCTTDLEQQRTGRGDLEQASCNTRTVMNAFLSTTKTFHFRRRQHRSLFVFVCLFGWPGGGGLREVQH